MVKMDDHQILSVLVLKMVSLKLGTNLHSLLDRIIPFYDVNGIQTMKSFHFSLNAGQGKVTVKSKQPVSLFEWHTIKVTRNKKIVKLTVDKQDAVEGTLPKTFTEIVLENSLIIGEPKQPSKR